LTDKKQILYDLLNHEDAIVRYNAINSLGFEFADKACRDKLIKIATGDSDDDCRRVASAALGSIYQNSKDKKIMLALSDVALRDSDEYVRSSAYKAVLIVNGLPKDKQLSLIRSNNLAVDKKRIENILGVIKNMNIVKVTKTSTNNN
jgi:HEAT repeat protein